MKALGEKSHAVSSRTSRTTACKSVSPRSTWPAGWLMTRRRLIRSSTTRNRPLFSATAATVTSGDLGMSSSIGAAACAESIIVGLSSCPASARQTQATVLRGARVPDGVEFLQVELRDGRVVGVSNAVPCIGPHAINDRAIVGDEIRRGALRGLGGDVANVDATRESAAHCDEAI